MNKYTIVVGGALLCFSFVALAQSPSECSQVPNNLITNCGFETGCFAGWAVTYSWTARFEGGEVAHSGEFGLKFDPRDSLVELGQGLATVAGQSYTLSFWVQNGSTPDRLQLWWNEELVLDTMTDPDTLFQQIVIDGLVAPSDGTMFWVGFANPSDYIYVDDFVVVPSE
ncbi:MAG TPA: hypothetical protein VKE49_06325 [Myxococcaceae bacterium]|nr:hypothetical protein [Myxococcaceae bacterium]